MTATWRSHVRIALGTLAMLLGAAACNGAVDEVTGTPTPSPEGTPAATMQTCGHPEHGYEVSYPAGWHTNPGDVIASCSVFDPDPIELQPDTEIPLDLGVIILVDPVPFDTAADPDERFERVLEREELEVDGGRAARLETEATGEGMTPEGTLSYRYVVDLDDERTLIASTYEVGDLDYEDKKGVLDRMVETLELGGSAPEES